ncbi:unnamed protein product, partial [Clonostachys rosea f. rosea IK726]
MQSRLANKYTVAQKNNYPTGVPAAVLVATKSLENPLSATVTFAAYYWARSAYVCQETFFAWYNNAMRLQAHVPCHRASWYEFGSNSVTAW